MADLFIPGKNRPNITQPQYGQDMRTIEIWAKHAGGGVASLSGTGISSPSGYLIQGGDFFIQGALSVAQGATLHGSIQLGFGADTDSTTIQGTTTVQAFSPNQYIHMRAGATGSADFSAITMNTENSHAPILTDPGTVCFTGPGASPFSVNVQFMFLTSPPTQSVINPTFAFVAGSAGHIYYNAGGITSPWTLLV